MYHVDQSAAEAVAHLSDLRCALQGPLYHPGDPGWDEARSAWNLSVDQRPAAVVLAESAADVEAVVRTARRLGLRVAPQGTGHGAAPLGDLSGTILLRTDRMRDVAVDPDAMTARVGAGALWQDVLVPAAAHGLAAAAGSSPDVGVVGYTLGGGLGWIGRSHGLAANSVTAIELVDDAGITRRVDAERDADLFWAARGGSVPGVVTALEFRLYPVPQLVGGALLWPIDRAADVAHAWREWVAEVPASVTSLARVLRYPPLPDLPPFLQGRAFVAVEAAIQEEPDEAARLLAPLRALEPEVDTVHPMPPSELTSIHGDPPHPVPSIGDGMLLARLDAGTIDAFVASATSEAAGALLSVEVRHLGGALAPGRGEGGAVSSLDGEGAVYAVGVAPSPGAAEAVAVACAHVRQDLAPHASPRAYRNFAEGPVGAEELYGESLDRLRRIAAEWDPTGLFVGAHAVA